MSDAELITDVRALHTLAPEWDALAVAASNPVAAPAWILSWWHHVAEPAFAARVVAVRDRGKLIGLAPFYAASGRHGVIEYRLMAGEFGMCMQPLALAGREWDVMAEVGRALAGAQPRPDVVAFGPMTVASHWTSALRSQWPGPVLGLSRQLRISDAPVIVLREPSFEAWFASLSSKMRHDLRRCERLFAEAGGTTRWSTAQTFRADAEAFSRLHANRWEGRGYSRLAALGNRLPDWLAELGQELLGEGRLRMCVLEIGGSPICVDFGLLAGEELATVNTGWDEQYARLAPAKLALLRVVQEAHARHARRIHLGVGAYANKLRFANGNDPAAWTMFMPPSPRMARTYGVALPGLVLKRARATAERALPPKQYEALLKLVVDR